MSKKSTKTRLKEQEEAEEEARVMFGFYGAWLAYGLMALGIIGRKPSSKPKEEQR